MEKCNINIKCCISIINTINTCMQLNQQNHYTSFMKSSYGWGGGLQLKHEHILIPVDITKWNWGGELLSLVFAENFQLTFQNKFQNLSGWHTDTQFLQGGN